MNTKIGCGVLIINDNDEILLLQRSYTHTDEPGYWTRPGGKIEVGESPEGAALREVKEEVGVDIKIIKPLINLDVTDSKNTRWKSYGYLAKIISGTPKNMELDKHIDMKWFSIQNLPENINAYTKDSIDAYLASK